MMLGLCQGCGFIDAFIPYIPYSRQDRSLVFHLILRIVKFLKVRHIITLDIHSDKQDDFIINILPHEIYGSRFLNRNLIVVAPDIGALNRSLQFAHYLNTALVTINKKTNEIRNGDLVRNRDCLIVDDIIDSGRTLNNAVNILRKLEARRIVTCITHDFKKYSA